jgi:arginyl-tRNA synthetase
VPTSGVTSLYQQIAVSVRGAIARVYPELADADPVVRSSEHTDFQANAALALAKSLGTNPRQLAGSIAAELGGAGAIAAVEVAGPGFLNVTVADRAVWQQIADRLDAPQLGVPSSEDGRRTVIDYSSPNVAKEMHVGHLRTTVIGDAIARVLGFLGGDVIRQNHLGDWGTQFGMLIQYLDEHPEANWRAAEVQPGESAVSALDALYRAARKEFDADEAFADRARGRVVALQGGDAETVARWHEIVDESAIAFRDIYARLGVLLQPEDSVGESFYNPMLADTVDELTRDGIAVESAGAVVIFSRTAKGPDGEPIPLILRKRDGGYGYDSTDLATIRYRIRDLKADRLLYVTDARQALHFQLVFEVAARAGWLPAGVVAEHVPYGTVLGPDGRPFKTRSGGTVRLAGLLDSAVAGARAVVAEKNPELPAEELDRIALAAGIGAVKYADLSTSRVKDYSFDLDRMVALSGNTSVYLQYAHARIQSILRRAGDVAYRVDTAAELAPAERALALHLDNFGGVLLEVATTLEPHRLCGYLYGLARAYTSFYDACPVLRAPEPQRSNRLALCRLTADTLRQGLGLLGIAAPERM